MNKHSIEIYQTDDGSIQLDVALGHETVWLTMKQIVTLFGRDKSVISRHISNLFREDELDRKAVVAKYATTAEDGKTYQVDHYNLDIIISIGYRVKSQQGVRFRQWATELIKKHLVQGYTLNQQRFEKNAAELEQALALIQKTAQSPELNTDSGRGLVEIISRYTQTFLWLQRYDEGLLNEPTGQRGGNLPSATDAMSDLNQLKQQLIERGEATHLFAQPHGDGLASLLGNLDQTVFGEPAYPTIESKAAHLLYFTVKNHPFSDGNKRSGAFLFVDFLHRNGRFPLFMPCLTKPDFAALQWHFIDVLMNTLLKVGATEQHMAAAEQLLAPLHIDSVCDRSVQGTINRMKGDVDHMLYFDQADITELSPRMTSAWLADRPCSFKGNRNGLWPQQAMLELLDNAAAPVSASSSAPTPELYIGDNIVSLANYRKGQHKQ